jgi:hypothetical protein
MKDPLRLLTRRGTLVVVGCIAVAGSLAADYSVRVITWAVMTDELQTTKLATSIAETGSPVPYIHGKYYAALSQLYPLLIAPFYWLLTAPAAATAAHVLNGFLLASAAWPAYLLARSVTGSRAAATVGALLTAFTPWLVLSTTLLTENAAYPAFVWAIFLCHRAIADPSAKRDIAALAALLLAFLARTQFFVLALALPLSLLGHELTFTASGDGDTRWLRLRARAKGALALHPILFSFYVTAGVAAAGLAAAGSLGAVVGNYAVPFRGDLLPSGIWHSAAAHLDYVVIGGGILPFVLAASWALTTAVRPEGRGAHAFAWLLLMLVPLLTFEVASFDLRFTPDAFVQDRYLFYLTPLFAVAAGAALVRPARTKAAALVALAVGASFAWLAGLPSYGDHPTIFWASPASAFHPAIAAAADWVQLSDQWFMRTVVVALSLVAAAIVMWPRVTGARVALSLSTSTLIAAFGAFEAVYVFERFAEPALTTVTFQQDRRDWIDAAVPSGSTVALVPSPLESSVQWWNAEYWNKDVERVLRVDDGPTFTPFPVDDVSVDFESGELVGAKPSDFLVVTPKETRFHLAEAGAHTADVTPLRLVRVEERSRLEWSTRGVSADGWTAPREEARLRFYGNGRPVRRALVVVLSAAREAPKPIGFTLEGRRVLRRGSVDPGGARPPVHIALCVPASGYKDVVMKTNGEARVPDGRVLALHFDSIEAPAVGTCSLASSKPERSPARPAG